jgi:hypothetical protein
VELSKKETSGEKKKPLENFIRLPEEESLEMKFRIQRHVVKFLLRKQVFMDLQENKSFFFKTVLKLLRILWHYTDCNTDLL